MLEYLANFLTVGKVAEEPNRTEQDSNADKMAGGLVHLPLRQQPTIGD